MNNSELEDKLRNLRVPAADEAVKGQALTRARYALKDKTAGIEASKPWSMRFAPAIGFAAVVAGLLLLPYAASGCGIGYR